MAKEKSKAKAVKKDVEPEDRTKLGAKFTRYVTRNEKGTLAEKGMLVEKHSIKSKVYGKDEAHHIGENLQSYPLVITKLRARGYVVVDVARDTFYVTSEIKFNDVCSIYCHNANWKKKGKFFFDTDKRPGLPVKDEKGNIVMIEQEGVLKYRYKDKKGNVCTEESPIPMGFVYTVTA